MEREQLLISWNQTGAEYPRNKTIHQLFEEQVRATPNKLAVVFKEQKLSYHELNCKANELAHYLRSQGVQAETPIALCMENCCELIIGILGILKAGGAYVPLNPANPPERLQFMLNDARAEILLTQAHLADRFKAYCQQGKMVLVDTYLHVKQQASHNLEPIANPENLAYIVYTSGSTGKPKGIKGHHRGMVSRISWSNRHYPAAPEEVYCQKTTISFIDSIIEILSPLLSGSTLAVTPNEIAKDPKELISFMKAKAVTRLFLVPSLMKMILEEMQPQELPSLRYFYISGEALISNSVRAFKVQFPRAKLLNMYGASESLDVTCYEADLWEGNGKVPIGRPVSNARCYILDADLKHCPIGEMGDLYVSGDGIARGYLTPELTADRFIRNPFCPLDDAHSILYIMGDKARYLPDGNIEYLGRADHQIKLRGIRIELGEIEAVLRQSREVKDAVVTVHQDNLVAYLIPANAKAEEVRKHCAQHLPLYMLPSQFVLLEKFPLNPNGKTDRKALPLPDQHLRSASQVQVAPRNELEKNLLALWSELLKLPRDQISIHDNFFALGGNSLSATQLRSRIISQLKINVSLRELFEYSTIATLASQLMTKKDQTAVGENLPPALVSQKRPSRLPLSFAQQRLWFIEQLLPNTAIYNLPLAFRLKGELNVSALERALKSLIERHEVLRTCLLTDASGLAEQVIVPIEACSFKLKQKELDGDLYRLSEAEALAPFDLKEVPLLRASLIAIDDKTHGLLLTMHHVVSDEWSMEIFCRELNAFYHHFAHQLPLGLVGLAVQYADFALWQRQFLQGEVLEKQLAYWKAQLADVPQGLDLPYDFVRPANLSYQGAHYEMQLDSSTHQKLVALGQEHQSSLFMVLLTALNILLYRVSQQETIVVGSPIANRHHQEIEGLIGFFVNTLALRTDLKKDQTFEALLSQVRHTTLEADRHQDLPFEQLVDQLAITRRMNQHPLFQVMLVLLNKDKEKDILELNGLEVEEISTSLPIAKFDLTINVREKADGNLHFEFEYATDLFKPETIERLAGHFNTLLQGIIANPQQSIGNFPLLSTAEQKTIGMDWNQTQADYPKDKSIHQLFEEQVNRTPNMIAVVFEDQKLTYQQLNERANQLGQYLRKKGVKTGTLVGICVDRSLELIIGLLGILKAGGAYVPLDPNYPPDRLAFMLEDTQAPIILTQAHLASRFDGSQRIVDLNDWDEIVRAGASSENSQGDLAYVIYTSGSTGKPKGVMIPHQNLGNVFSSLGKTLSMTAEDKWLAITSIGFDIAGLEIFLPLLNGAQVILASQTQTKDMTALAELLNKKKITIMQATPALWRMFLDQADELANPLKVLVGGEALAEDLAEKLLTSRSIKELWNLYGPTETTIWSTFTRVQDPKKITIGKPLSNTQIYILDSQMQVVPIGVAGELYIGGSGVGRGYINRPELTAERFIENPFDSHTRLYRTGDLVRYSPDGNIEYLGRMDNQVKIRGYRIECGEIESVMIQNPQLRESIVIAREDEPGQKRLVAYCVAQKGLLADEQAAELVETLRAECERCLPNYMLPSAFIWLEKLPLNPNGKIDRKALPAPDKYYRSPAQSYLAPRNVLEEQLTALFSLLVKLTRDQISIHDNFFDIGGNSMLVIQLMARIKALLPVELSVAEIYKHPTIALITEIIEQKLIGRHIQQAILLPIVTANSRKPALFLIHPSGGNASCYFCFSEIKNRSVYGISSPYFGQSTNFESLALMAATYIREIKKIQARGPYYLGGWSFGGTVALEMANQLSAQGETLLPLIFIDTHNFSKSVVKKPLLVAGGNLDGPVGEIINIEDNKTGALLLNYDPPSYFGRVILLKAQDTDADTFNGWKELLPQLEMHSIPGSHDHLFDQEFAPNIVKRVQFILECKSSDFLQRGWFVEKPTPLVEVDLFELEADSSEESNDKTY